MSFEETSIQVTVLVLKYMAVVFKGFQLRSGPYLALL